MSVDGCRLVRRWWKFPHYRLHPRYVACWDLDTLPRENKICGIMLDYLKMTADFLTCFRNKITRKTLFNTTSYIFFTVGILLSSFLFFFFFFLCLTYMFPPPLTWCQPTCPSSSHPLIPSQVSVIFELTSEKWPTSHGWWHSVCVCVCVLYTAP